jgi:hypothetical protein
MGHLYHLNLGIRNIWIRFGISTFLLFCVLEKNEKRGEGRTHFDGRSETLSVFAWKLSKDSTVELLYRTKLIVPSDLPSGIPRLWCYRGTDVCVFSWVMYLCHICHKVVSLL